MWLTFSVMQEVNVDTENDGIQESQLLIKSGFSSSDHGKYSGIVHLLL